MSGQVPFFLVDVFAGEPLTGNPLAVVADGEELDAAVMARMAREFNQAETTFVLPPSRAGADWRLRCFTAAGIEVYGAGHNSLGAWWWLAESGRLALGKDGGAFVQEIGPRLLPVNVVCRDGRLISVGLTQTEPVFGEVWRDRAELAMSLGLEERDLVDGPVPAQVVSTGAAHLLVPVCDCAAIARARPDMARLKELLRRAGGQGCYLFSTDVVSPQAVAHTRFFNPTEGIPEDAATGSAAGPLACLLVKHGLVADGATMAIEQGYSMGRPSLIRVRVSAGDVRVTGSCVTVAQGAIRW